MQYYQTDVETAQRAINTVHVVLVELDAPICQHRLSTSGNSAELSIPDNNGEQLLRAVLAILRKQGRQITESAQQQIKSSW
jgi:hypothetical protein